MIRITQAQQIFALLRMQSASMALLRFPLPDLGEKIKQGKVKKLYVKEGDKIKEFEKLADVQSDKQFTQITSPEDGTIKKIYYREDQTCAVGDIFLEIDTLAEEPTEQPIPQQKHEKVVQKQPAPNHSHHNDEVLASATVKMWARQHKINLEQLKGTGRKGRILKEDVIEFIENRQNAKPINTVSAKVQSKPQVVSQNGISKVTMSNQQKQLQQIVNYSNSVPHLYYQQTFDVSQIQQIISRLKQKQPKISLLSILIKTFSLALKDYPRMNSTYNINDPFQYKTHPHYNIILPYFQSHGIVFNAIQNAEGLNIRQIQKTISNFQNKGLSSHELSAGTICISQIGSLGAHSMNPLIYGELACHASIGVVRKVPTYTSGTLVQRQVVDITMGCDHRVLDGATVARFTSAWRDYSERPTLAFLSMI